MAFLGITSATKVISVGLSENGIILAETTVADKQAFTEDLILHIDQIVGARPDAPIHGIAVVQGPGSYSGLRGGLSVAKTLAQTMELPLLGVSALEALANNLIDCDSTIAAMTNARRKEFNFAVFAARDRKIKRLTEDFVMESPQIIDKLSKIKGKITLVGEIVDIYEELKTVNPDTKIVVAEPANCYPRGGIVGAMGERLFKEHGISEDILKMVPKYSHKPNIREWKGR
ncbi:MAG: tRNA (adenosine(37)-N6)-threonylcarbamoyltransferase complex dimerization subunit type 1 TsaB [Candidatus Margulisiibacteriota bacterium]|nr:tRNA (adenosine(37)-N6)-threonylcarbamoyltransferase complex dimerization subunit type 1 TsaB [Candidatus Margulisiibacteriota bacterium]